MQNKKHEININLISLKY